MQWDILKVVETGQKKELQKVVEMATNLVAVMVCAMAILMVILRESWMDFALEIQLEL